MADRVDPTKIYLLFLIVIMLTITSAGKNDLHQEYNSNQMALSIYVDKDGKALVTGYAEDINGLDFLSSSQYQYKNKTNELYALTDSMTSKYRDNWTLRFSSHGYYDEYHAKFFLPSMIRLRKINCSTGLEYIIYTFNDSLVAEIAGYDLRNPITTLEYQMPIDESSSNTASANSDFSFLPIIMLVVFGISIVAILSRRMIRLRSIKAAPKEPSKSDPYRGIFRSKTAQIEEATMRTERPIIADGHDEPSPQTGIASTAVEVLQLSGANSESSSKGNIVITHELAAVMEVLTARERTILEALLKHGGKMTQAEIKYETETPGSTLTGILLSLERRKIVTKKEQGRTNVIELSKWVLSKKEDS